MNRKIMFSLVIIVMALALVIGGTFAWFTAQDEVTNTFVAGTVLFDLTEYMESDSALSSDKLTATNVNPGDCYTKKFTIENVGTKYILLRMNFTEEWLFDKNFLVTNWESLGFTEPQKVALAALTPDSENPGKLTWTQVATVFNLVDPVKWDDIEADLVGFNWIENTNNGYWYYDSTLAGTFDTDSNKIDTLVFNFELCFDGATMDNVFQASYYSLTIGVEAIQASNNASGLGGWGVDSWYYDDMLSKEPTTTDLNLTGENWSEWDPNNPNMN